jgi:membrane protease YdiL (CAAX protease family)
MIRAALARMWDNVLFVIGALLLVLGIHASYPFQLNRRLEGFLWTDVAVGVAAVLFVFVRMERDEVLSNIRSSTPGQIKWDRDFIVKLIVYGLIPVAGLFAAEFPEVGGTVLGWIQPLQKALP